MLIVVVGTLLGFVLARRRSVFAKALDPLLMIPYIIPGTVVGIGFIVAFGKPPLFLLGTGFIIVLAYFIRSLPYSVRSAASILKQIDPALEEAGINLGAPPARTFRMVTMPLMMPGHPLGRHHELGDGDQRGLHLHTAVRGEDHDHADPRSTSRPWTGTTAPPPPCPRSCWR